MTAKEIIRAVKKTDIHASFFASDDMKYPDGRRPATAEDYKRLCGEENIGISVAAAEMRTEGGHLCQSNEDIVILSPAFTSFDRFNNFEERGRLFKKVVNDLDK